MYDEMRVKYLFVNLKYQSYLKLQVFLVGCWFIAAILCYMYLRDSADIIFKNAWWLCPIVAILEIGESYFAINKAKKAFVEQAAS